MIRASVSVTALVALLTAAVRHRRHAFDDLGMFEEFVKRLVELSDRRLGNRAKADSSRATGRPPSSARV